MFRNPYEIQDNMPRDEFKKSRENIIFPRPLPSNSNYPVHELNFIDRNFINGRKSHAEKPVQNEYLQRYQIHELQQNFDGNHHFEQMQVDRIQKTRADGGLMGLERNMDDVNLRRNFDNNHFNCILDRPADTRSQKEKLNYQREPMAKVLGGPPQYYKP